MKKLIGVLLASLLLVACGSTTDKVADREYIGVIAAMDEELEAILDLVEDMKEVKEGYFTYYVGIIGDKDVVLTKSGVGKSLSAMTTTALISNFKVSSIINIGSAGALQADIEIGDVVVGERVAVSDFDLTGFGYVQSFEEERFTFKGDSKLIDTMKSLNLDNIHFGDMVSSDTFISSEKHVDNILGNFPTTLCADMEAASIAMVLNEFDIQLIVVRAISDNVVETKDNAVEFDEFLKLASKNSATMTVKLIEAL